MVFRYKMCDEVRKKYLDLCSFSENVEVEVNASINEAVKGENMVEKTGKRPEYRVVQFETDKNGKSVAKSVGAIWMNESGKTAGVLKIGDLRLPIFKNEPKQ